MRKKTVPLKKLKNELDRIFSLWIRQKDAKDGMVQCVTCGKIGHWREFHCGHYISRRHLATRWEVKNCAVQSVSCNIFNQGAGPQFALYLIKKYGTGILEWLEIKKNNQMKMDRFAYESLIEGYKQEIINIGGELK